MTSKIANPKPSKPLKAYCFRTAVLRVRKPSKDAVVETAHWHVDRWVKLFPATRECVDVHWLRAKTRSKTIMAQAASIVVVATAGCHIKIFRLVDLLDKPTSLLGRPLRLRATEKVLVTLVMPGGSFYGTVVVELGGIDYQEPPADE